MLIIGGTASAWNGVNMSCGTCTLHSYNDSTDDEAEPKMGRSVNEKLVPTNYELRNRPG
jgi:DDB1- and CUL4-associated factor 11